ncbi:MAG TPA: amino acid ABC transporter permease [Candidatus Acidoferrum sp.]|jgi:polar amino acid transport system permease protein|nr:amino acid ABC transporter permease [Candidatus Acidoferrum sp.]
MFGLTIEQLGFIVRGAGWTIVLSLLGFVGGTLVGLPIALARSSNNRWLPRLSAAFVQLVQGIPLPVIMFVVYFGISIGGFDIPALVAAGIAMTLYSSAYLGEIWKGSIQAIPSTQWEASECLALTPVQGFVYVILPQAVRVAIPPTVGFLVQIVKNTSYSVVIGFTDLTYAAKVINNATFRPFLVFTIAAGIYFVICYPMSLLSRKFERSLKRS